MKVTRPYLSFLYAKKLSSVLLLFTIILTGLLLYPPFELKSFVIKPAFGQAVQTSVRAATKTATAENTLAPLRTPVQEPSSHLPNYQQQSFPPPRSLQSHLFRWSPTGYCDSFSHRWQYGIRYSERRKREKLQSYFINNV